MEPFQQPQSDPKDVELENNVSRMIRHIAHGVRVHVRGGHVTVSGIVDDFGKKRQITSSIQSIGGVREVTNNIRVTQD